MLIDVICIPAETTLSTDATISTGATVAVTAVIIGTIALIIGALTGVLVYHCISKHRTQSSKPETSSHQQQPAGFLLRSFVPAVEREILY